VRRSMAFLAFLVVGCGETFSAQTGSGSGGGGSGAGGETTAASAAGGGGSGAAGGGGSGAAGGSGGGQTYGETECDVPTGISLAVQSPTCAPGTAGCVADWAGAFGQPGHLDGEAASARFVGLYGIALGEAYAYVTTAHAVRRIHLETGVVETVAGSTKVGNDDGAGEDATFHCPRGIALGEGELYVADHGNSSVRHIDLATGQVTTVPASFVGPNHVLLREGMLHVTGTSDVRRFDLATETLVQFPSDGPPALNDTGGLAYYPEYNLFYLADSGNHIVRKIGEGNLGPAQVGAAPGYLDGSGTNALLRFPRGLIAIENTLFVADQENHRIRTITPTAGYVTATLAGNGTPLHQQAVGPAAGIVSPTDLAYHPGSGDLFVAEGTVIRRVHLP
jgi:hypothetical protein